MSSHDHNALQHQLDFSTNRLLFSCPQPSQSSSHESVDSGCCEGELGLNACSRKAFDTFNLLANSPASASNPPLKRAGPMKSRVATSTRKEEERASSQQQGGSTGASYKYLTWREKDRRRRFREEWKHLWLVVPHGMYEVMCLVCHKIMTQRKLDTIKRHTIRRHAELLSMSEAERQSLFQTLVSQYFRRGGELCGEADPFGVTSVPRLRQTGPRRHNLIPQDAVTPNYRPRRPETDKSIPQHLPESAFNPTKALPPLPMNLKSFDGIQSAFTKYLMGLNSPPMPLRGKFEPPINNPWRRNPLQHTCGMNGPHAFQTFRKQPQNPVSPPESLNERGPLDMSASATNASPDQISPSDLSVRKGSTSSSSENGTSLTERLMQLVNTWDSAAITLKTVTPIPTPLSLMPVHQSDATALMLNR